MLGKLFYKNALLIVLLAIASIGAFKFSPLDKTRAAILSQDDLQAPQTNLTFKNDAPIALNDATIAAPYPSAINVSNVSGTIEKLTVTLNNFGHSFPDDVDILLVAPNGNCVVLMSDAGGGFNVTGIDLTFDNAATASLPDLNLLESGVYKPTNFGVNDNFPFPAPVQASSTTLSVFNGANPNGAWNLYAVDDAGQDAGIIAGGWSLTISNGITAQNQTAINIPDSGAASVYPSNINVSGQTGIVVGVKVSIDNLTHAAPDDLDLLLVAPNGRSIVLMSDAGGNNTINNVSLVFDDTANVPLPDDGQIVSGTFKPTNYGVGDSFPPPAPNGNVSGATLSAFNGINPNGVWSLYLVDDASGNAGVLAGGWSLSLKTSATACAINAAGTQVFAQAGGAGSLSIATPVGCDWTARSLAPDFLTLQTESGSGNSIVNFTVSPNAGDSRTGSIIVSNSNFSQTFTVQQASGCPFALAQDAQTFAASGGFGQVEFTASINCFWTVSSNSDWLKVTSQPTGAYGNSVVTFTVAPNGTEQMRTAVITIGARTLTVTQNAGTGCPYVVGEASQYAAFGGASNPISVLANAACNWTATSSVDWITINSGKNGSGNGTIAYTVAPNNTNSARTGTIVVNDYAVTILQGRRAETAPFDFDGDGKTDFAVFRPSNGTWYILRSSDGGFVGAQFGLGTDKIVAADYDGDRRTDLAVFRQGSWFVLNSSTNTMSAAVWGIAGDVAAPGDYDADGRADFAVFRPSQTTWYVLQSSNNGILAQQFGAPSDAPVSGDYDGDGKTDFVLRRAGLLPDSPSLYFIRYSAGGSRTLQFGSGGDLPVPADYDADGRTNFAVFRPSGGNWFRSPNLANNYDEQIWGAQTDIPVPGDYDGDGRADAAVFRRGVWYVFATSDNAPKVAQWGAPTDLPISSIYKPDAP